MTREEAISWLKKIKVKYIHGGDEDFDAKRREAIGMAIAALREQPQWISVQEKLPEKNDKVLAFTLSGKYAVARYDQRRQCWIAAGNLTVTHWMPLPDVPEVEV